MGNNLFPQRAPLAKAICETPLADATEKLSSQTSHKLSRLLRLLFHFTTTIKLRNWIHKYRGKLFHDSYRTAQADNIFGSEPRIANIVKIIYAIFPALRIGGPRASRECQNSARECKIRKCSFQHRERWWRKWIIHQFMFYENSPQSPTRRIHTRMC